MSEYISLSLFVKGFKDHLRQIILITVIVGVVFTVLTLCFYKNKYVSTTMVYFDRLPSPVVQGSQYREDSADTSDAVQYNFFKSQLQILKSDLVMQKVFERIQKDSVLAKQLKLKKYQDVGGYLKADSLKETDIIALSAKAGDPVLAQKLSQYYAEAYQYVSTTTYLKPTTLKKESLEKKIAEMQTKLDEKTAQLASYEKQMGIIDADQQRVDSASHLETLRQEEEAVAANIAASRSELNRLQSQIGLSSKNALNAVAVGQDDVYNSLASDLADAEREYDSGKSIYTDNHPYMTRLKARINALKSQLSKASVSNTGVTGVNRVIRDQVRASLVQRASALEATLQGLISQDVEKLKQIRLLSQKSLTLPVQGLAVDQLKAEIDSLSDVLLQLQASLEDVKLQLSYGKVYLYAPASFPEKAEFPSVFQLPILLIVLTFLASSFAFGAYENYRHTQFCSIAALNELYKIPTLAIVPWVGSFEPTFVSMELFGHVFNAFALRLKAEKNKTGHQSYIMTSVQSQGSQRFTALKSLAVSLGKTGDKVLIMETSLWPGSLRQEFFQQLDFASSIPLDKLIAESLTSLKKKITSNIYPLTLNSNVYFLDLFTEQSVDNFALLSSPAFKQMIELLRTEFDWILCDSPSLIRHSETYALINSFDSMVLMVERDTPKENAYQAIQQVQNLGGYIAGVAVRNIGT